MIDKTDMKLYTVSDIQEMFDIGRTSAYKLMSSDGFPSFRVGRKMYISDTDLRNWIKRTKYRLSNS